MNWSFANMCCLSLETSPRNNSWHKIPFLGVIVPPRSYKLRHYQNSQLGHSKTVINSGKTILRLTCIYWFLLTSRILMPFFFSRFKLATYFHSADSATVIRKKRELLLWQKRNRVLKESYTLCHSDTCIPTKPKFCNLWTLNTWVYVTKVTMTTRFTGRQ